MARITITDDDGTVLDTTLIPADLLSEALEYVQSLDSEWESE